MHAIPTMYKGIQFRSRLEAKWAAFFDIFEMPWTYEPFDLDGYIPDFIVGGDTLVEVKGEPDPRALSKHFIKIRKAGWDDVAVLLGASPFRYRETETRKPWPAWQQEFHVGDFLAVGMYQHPPHESQLDVCCPAGLAGRRVVGFAADRLLRDHDIPGIPDRVIEAAFAEASNAVQWCPPPPDGYVERSAYRAYLEDEVYEYDGRNWPL